jgi:hypothetical protein
LRKIKLKKLSPETIPAYLEPGQVLQLREVTELQVERVNADEGENVEDVEEEPDDEHQDVVGEDHVVDDA